MFIYAKENAAAWVDFTRRACALRSGKIAHRMLREINPQYVPKRNGIPLDLDEAAAEVKAAFDPHWYDGRSTVDVRMPLLCENRLHACSLRAPQGPQAGGCPFAQGPNLQTKDRLQSTKN